MLLKAGETYAFHTPGHPLEECVPGQLWSCDNFMVGFAIHEPCCPGEREVYLVLIEDVEDDAVMVREAEPAQTEVRVA